MSCAMFCITYNEKCIYARLASTSEMSLNHKHKNNMIINKIFIHVRPTPNIMLRYAHM